MNPDSLPVTENENPRTTRLSSASVAEILKMMNDEDGTVAAAVGAVLPEITAAVEGVVQRLENGGRLFYIGTGTSGRLGVLDAAECPPTFGVDPSLVQGIIAGGYDACHRAVEASEDDAAAAKTDLETREFSPGDVLVGLTASGTTPYTVGAIEHAAALRAFTVGVTCNPNSPITKAAKISIVPLVGPEVVAGSTRLKAGTAQKMVLNMISTASLAKLGYVTGNRMTNLLPRNEKLRARALRVLIAETKLESEKASALLARADGDPRVALVMFKTGKEADDARRALADAKGVVQVAVSQLQDR